LSMLSLVLVLGIVAACSNASNSGNTNASNSSQNESSNNQSSEQTGSSEQNQEVKITFFNTSAEVNTVYEELFEKYNELNPHVTVELIPTPIGGAQIERFQSLIASGNPPTIANLDAGHIYQYKDLFLDVESEKAKYEELTMPGTVDSGIFDGK